MTKVILIVFILACGITPCDARAVQRLSDSLSVRTLSAGELAPRFDEPAVPHTIVWRFTHAIQAIPWRYTANSHLRRRRHSTQLNCCDELWTS